MRLRLRTPSVSAALSLLLAAAPCLLAQAQPPAGNIPWAELVDTHIATMRERTLAQCAEKGIELPKDFVAWVDSDPIVRTTVYGCRKDPLPVLLLLRSLEIDLGEQVVRRDYTQLALAFAIQDSYAVVNFRAIWNSASERYYAEAFLENAFDEEYHLGGYVLAGFDYQSVFWAKPRWFGARLGVNF